MVKYKICVFKIVFFCNPRNPENVYLDTKIFFYVD